MTNGPACSNCGRINRPNAKFCSSCGKPLAAAALPPPPKLSPRQPSAPPSHPAPQSTLQPTAPKPPKRSRVAWWQIVLIGAILLGLCACVLIAIFFGDSLSRFVALPPTVVLALTTPTPFGLAPPPITGPTTTAPTSAPIQPLPILTPTVTFLPDTSIGATLKPDETWRQQNMMLTLQRQKFANVECGGFLEFDLVLENFEPSEIVVNWRGDDISAKNDQDIPFPLALFQPSPKVADCAKYIPLQGASFLPALGGRKTFGITIQVRGQLDDKVNKIYVVVAKAGRIQNARWEIPVPR
jgi:hypothetical protein